MSRRRSRWKTWPTFSIELDSGWTLESAVVDNELLGFFAWIPESEVTPGNVHLAWLEHVGGGAWVMVGWNDSTSANAVGAIAIYLGDETALEGVDTESIDGSVIQRDNCGGPVITSGGEAMPAGATQSDPASPLLEAIAGQPGAVAISQILAQSGASVAPGLTELMLANSPCPGVSELDSTMSNIAVLIAENTEIAFAPEEQETVAAIASNCGLCLPWTWTQWGPWSTWTCTGGPTPIAGAGGSCGCRYTGCTRTRTGNRRHRDIFCTVTTIATVAQTQGPQNRTCPSVPPQTSNCPPQPNC